MGITLRAKNKYSFTGQSAKELAKMAKPDSIYLGFIMKGKPLVTTDYTKPFTYLYLVPMGLSDGKDNATVLYKRRNKSMAYLKTTTKDLRMYFQKPGRPSIYQVFINVFGHTNRHLC